MRMVLCGLAVLGWLVAGLAQAAVTPRTVADGFEKTVFRSEYPGLAFGAPYVRKFRGEVRVWVSSTGRRDRRRTVERFARSLAARVRGLRVRIVASEREANFRVFVVDRRQYARTVRLRVYRNSSAPVRGRCMVRSLFSRSGIRRSDAVIVGDEGERLFRRCMAEEFMQGLGPLNDDTSLRHSMFNDRTRFTRPTRFDIAILNALYDRRIRNGMSLLEARRVLPRVAREALRRAR